MKHKELSKRHSIHVFLICGMMCLFLLTVAVNGYPNTHAYVAVGGSWIDKTDPIKSSAILTRTLGSSFAEADMSAGTLKTYAYTSTLLAIPGFRGVDVNASASFDDNFTIQGLPAGVNWIEASLHITGRIFSPGGGSANSFSGYDIDFGPGADEKIFGNTSADKPIDVTLTQTYFVSSFDPFRVQGSLQSYAHGWDGNNPFSDFSNTAILSFALPDGTTITSEGGFYQSASSTVPEPATMLLLGIGLVGLAGTRRRMSI